MLIPTAEMLAVFKEATLALVNAKTLSPEKATVAVVLPEILSVAPVVGLLRIPTDVCMKLVLRVTTLTLVSANTVAASSAFEVHTFPATLRVAPLPVVLIPVIPVIVRTFRVGVLDDTVNTSGNRLSIDPILDPKFT